MIRQRIAPTPLLLGALVFFACSPAPVARPAGPIAASVPATAAHAPPSDTVAPTADADAPAPAVGCLSPEDAPGENYGGPWVSFYGPPYHGDHGPTTGPQWAFYAPGLPALSSDGARILVFAGAVSLGADPGIDVVVKRLADSKIVSSTPALDRGAFNKVHDLSPDEEAMRRAYDALKTRTIDSITRLNARLTAEGWRSLTSCRIDIASDETKPGCSMREQQIQCGSAKRLIYQEPRLDIVVLGRKTSARKTGWVAPPETVPGDPDQKVKVQGCVADAWFEPARGVAVFYMDYVCHGAGGDWCSPSPRWEVVKLPVAPSSEPPHARGSGACPQSMAAIPAGSFTMGSAVDTIDELPPHAATVDATCLDATEVTVAQYRACIRAGRCFDPEPTRLVGSDSWGLAEVEQGCNWGVPGREGHPMNCSPHAFAEEYCDWLGKRLPTEAEWEFAARGPQGQKYPWGGGEPPGGICWDTPSAGTCAVATGTADKSPFGVTGLAANVREWTSTTYARYNGCGRDGRYVVRGGDWRTIRATELRASRRDSLSPSARDSGLGFRCAMTK